MSWKKQTAAERKAAAKPTRYLHVSVQVKREVHLVTGQVRSMRTPKGKGRTARTQPMPAVPK